MERQTSKGKWGNTANRKAVSEYSKSKTVCETLIQGYETSLEKVGTLRRKIFNNTTKEVLPQKSKNTLLHVHVGDSEKYKNNPFPKELNCANPKKGREIANWAYALCSKYFDEFDLLVPWLWYAATTKDFRCPLRPPRVWSKTDGEPILKHEGSPRRNLRPRGWARRRNL